MSFPLAIVPASANNHNPESLFSVIQQIFDERGHLRDVTEEVLQAEIEEENLRDEESGGSDAEKEQSLDIDGKHKELYAARMEMLQLASQANNEALTLLDLVSLLLSKNAAKLGQSSMSPALKDRVPLGSLGFDKNDTPKIDASSAARNKAASIGLNFISLNSAANMVHTSATRLEEEMRKETIYWEQILSVSEAGWALCRIPRQEHTVGVRFGFSEATPQFQGRGLAALQPDITGNLVLDAGSTQSRKNIRVRIAEQGIITDEMQVPILDSAGNESLEEDIRRARDSLFDEELFHELLREARSLFSYGVRVRGGVVSVPLRLPDSARGQRAETPSLEVLIDFTPQSKMINASSRRCGSFALILRLFLTYAYRQRYRQRSELPQPLSSEQHGSPVLTLLRPLLNHVEHQQRVVYIQRALSGLAACLNSAGIDCDVSVKAVAEVKLSQSEKNPTTPASSNVFSTPMEALIRAFQGPLTTIATLMLPLSREISITVTSQIYAPLYGTSYQVECFPKMETLDMPLLTPNDTEELLHQVEAPIRDSIAQYIISRHQQWIVDANGKDVILTNRDSGKKVSVRVKSGKLSMFVQNEKQGKWDVVRTWDDLDRQQYSLEEELERIDVRTGEASEIL